MDDLLQEVFDAKLVVVGLFFLRRFGLGPRSDISRTSPSRRIKLSIWVGTREVGFGLVPHFALGPLANVPGSASTSGDFLMVRMSDVKGWFDVRGPDISDVGVTAPSGRVRDGILRNGVDAIRGQDTVSTPSSFQALTVLWLTRGRRCTHVAESTSAKRFAATREGTIRWLDIFVLTAAVMARSPSFRAKSPDQLRFDVRDLFREGLSHSPRGERVG